MPERAQAQSFAVIMGNDTIAVERFTRTADQLSGELKTKGMGPRITYTLELSGGMPTVLRTSAYRGDADSTLFQSAVLTFKGDSVIADITAPGGPPVTQRMATEPGAFPFINPSFALWEPVLARVTSGTASIPVFTVSGGRTYPVSITRSRPDSATINIGGVAMAVQLNERGEITGAIVPSQNLRVVRSAGALRLEEPKRDYSAPANASYTAEDVTIKTPGGYTLAGTLTLPKNHKARVPVVVTVSGSGQQDRDEALPIVSGYRPFRQIAEALAARGVGVLRYDDRGFGASTGDPSGATSVDFAEDTKAVLAYLRTRSDVDARNLFLVGHSEGGMIAPMVAAQDPALRGIVLMAGPAWRGRRILEYQNRYLVDHLGDRLQAERDSLYKAALVELDSLGSRQAWIRWFMDYDPLPTARRVKTPVLILQGSTDRQITAEQANELAAAFRAGGNRDVTVHVLPEVNHLFLADPDGNPGRYSSLENRMVVASALQLLTDWIVKHSAVARSSK